MLGHHRIENTFDAAAGGYAQRSVDDRTGEVSVERPSSTPKVDPTRQVVNAFQNAGHAAPPPRLVLNKGGGSVLGEGFKNSSSLETSADPLARDQVPVFSGGEGFSAGSVSVSASSASAAVASTTAAAAAPAGSTPAP